MLEVTDLPHSGRLDLSKTGVANDVDNYSYGLIGMALCDTSIVFNHNWGSQNVRHEKGLGERKLWCTSKMNLDI